MKIGYTGDIWKLIHIVELWGLENISGMKKMIPVIYQHERAHGGTRKLQQTSIM